MIDAVLEDTGCNIDVAISWATNAKNSLNNVFGFSSHQLVFGKNPDVPGLSNYKNLPCLDEFTSSKIVADNLNAMTAARKAFVTLENGERLKRLLRERVYEGANAKYYSGDSVYYKRANQKGPWLGPGIVVGHLDNQVLVKHGGSLIRLLPCKVVLKETAEGMVDGDIPSQKEHKVPDISSSMQVPEHANISGHDSDSSDDDGNDQQCPDVNNSDLPTEEWDCISERTSKTPVVMKKNDVIRFRSSETDSWTQAVVESRAGKSTGKDRNQFNIITGEDADIISQMNADDHEVHRLKVPENTLFCEEEEVTLYTDKSDAMCSDLRGIKKAKDEEIQRFKDCDVYEEVKNIGQSTISCRWVITRKSEGVYKARLVARGFEDMLVSRVDAPTVNSSSVFVFLAICVSNRWTIEWLDITCAFLQAKPINREVYLNPPADVRTRGIVWKIKKPVYGLGDSARLWYLTLKDHLVSNGCKISILDQSVFRVYHEKKLIGLLVTHVDDVLFAGTTRFHQTVMKSVMQTFKISKQATGIFTYLGLSVTQDKEAGMIKVDQTHYSEGIKTIEMSVDQKKTHYSVYRVGVY